MKSNPKFIFQAALGKDIVIAIRVATLVDHSNAPQNIASNLEVSVDDLIKRTMRQIPSFWADDFDAHIDRVKNADPSYPIIVFKGDVIDGAHRLVKAYLSGAKTIQARSIKSLPASERISRAEFEGIEEVQPVEADAE